MTNVSIIGSQHVAQHAADPLVRSNEAVPSEQIAKLEAAAERFESFFIAQMLRQMRAATRQMASEDSVFNSHSSENMLDMADVALADSLAGYRAFGIADVIVRQLLPTLAGGAPEQTSSAVPSPAVKETVRPVALDKR